MSRRIKGMAYALPGIALAAGVKTVFSPCIHTDGSTSACSACGQWIFVLACVLLAAAIVRPFLPRKICPVTDLVLMLLCALVLLIPGMTGTCMMNSMRCNTLMKPYSIAMAVVGLVIYGFCLFCDSKALKEKK